MAAGAFCVLIAFIGVFYEIDLPFLLMNKCNSSDDGTFTVRRVNDDVIDA